MIKRAVLFVITIAILLAGCAGDVTTEEPQDIAEEFDVIDVAEVSPVPAPEPVPTQPEPPEPPEPDEPEEAEESKPEPEPEIFWTHGTEYVYDLAWRVLPMLEFDAISRCTCGRFIIGRLYDVDWPPDMVDTTTGENLGVYDGAHGMFGMTRWVYDRERGLFGHPGGLPNPSMTNTFYPLDEFADYYMYDSDWREHFLDDAKWFNSVESVDTSLYDEVDDDRWGFESWLTADAYLGVLALMYDLEFVTDFIFDEVSPIWYRTGPVRWQGRWGVINREGYTIVPFVFEHIILIDERTAFAKYDGAYGILDLRHTLEALQS